MGFGSTRLRILAIAAIAGMTLSLPAQAQSAMDDAWQSVLRRWVGDGWKPFHEAGYNFATSSGGKSWGAGLRAGAPVAFAAVCSDCTGVQMILRDGARNIVASANVQQGSTSLLYTPPVSSAGSIELIPVGCRKPACPVRYTSFTRR